MRRVFVIAAILAVGAVLVGPLACRQIAGIGSSPETELTTTVCGLPYGTNTCAACASTNCCAESNACAADSIICSPYESCLGACGGDPECRSKCTIHNPVPVANAAPVSALNACLAKNCEAQCGLGCGSFAGYLSMPDAAAGCATCLEQKACNDERACGASGDCDAFWRCYLACVTPDCQTACVSTYDAGAALFKPLYGAFSGTCATACGYGSYWACVPRSSWPSAGSKTFTWTEWVYDWESRKGVAGAQVSACTGCPCPTATNIVVAQGQTDQNGYVTLSWPLQTLPNGQALTYCEQVTAPGYLTNVAYGGFPASGPSWSVNGLLPPEGWGLVLLTPSAQQMNDMAVGATYDPARAIYVAAGVFDCLGSPVQAGGAEVTLNVSDPEVLALNVVDAGPDALPTATTGAAGQSYSVLFFDVPVDAGATPHSAPYTVQLTAMVPGIGVVSQVSANVAPNTITQVGLTPTPSP